MTQQRLLHNHAQPKTKRKTAHLIFSLLLSILIILTLSFQPANAASGTIVGKLKLSATTVLAGKPLTISSSTGVSNRTVQLQRLDMAGKWRSLGTKTAAKNGTFTFNAPTKWYGTHQLRVWAPATKTAREWVSQPVKITVNPTYATAGKASSHKLEAGRWNPCKPITYRINTAGAYKGWDKQVHAVMAEMSRATGLTFVYKGTTTEVAFGNKRSKDSDIIFSWATAKQNPDLAGAVVGLGGSYYTQHQNGTKERFKGSIVLDRAEKLDTTWDGVRITSWSTVMLHELTHVLGVGHTTDKTQLMAPVTGLKPRFGKGDLAALSKVGAANTCITPSIR